MSGKLRALALGLVGFGLFVGLWWIATLGHKVSDPPSPPLTFSALLEIAASGELWSNTIASVFRVAWGFVLAAAIGIPFGIALGWYDPLEKDRDKGFELNVERAKYWLSKGAKVSDTVRSMLKRNGVQTTRG